MAVSFLESLGLTINFEKSMLVPSQQMEFLGVIFNSLHSTFAIPIEKSIKIQSSALSLLADGSPKAIDLASFLGKANFVSIAAPNSTSNLRWLQRDSNKIVQPDRLDTWQMAVKLSQESLLELRWWADNIMVFTPLSLVPFSPCIKITTDASKLGFGVVCCGKKSGGLWTPEESQDHINLLELRAIWFGLLCFARNWKDIDILIECDNTAAISYIRNRGGTASSKLTALAQQILDWCTIRNLRVQTTHIAGVLNVEADEESRKALRGTAEWAIDSSCLTSVFDTWGTPDVDLFASRVNHKLPRYFSLFTDPYSEAVDAFAQSWCGLSCYGFPPFALIGRTLQKAENDLCHLVLITPWWPGQHWFPQAMSLASDVREIPRTPHLLTDLAGETHPLLKQMRFSLLAWKICPGFGGLPESTRMWVTRSLIPGLRTRDLNITLHYVSGLSL
jgi:hypothetical protein